MKKTIITVILVCYAATSMSGQPKSQKGNTDFEAGIIGGLNIPNLTGGGDNPLSSGWSSRTGASFGITGTMRLGENLFLRADAIYSSEGGKRDGMQPVDASSLDPSVPPGYYVYANFKNESILNYIEIPVMIKYKYPVGRSSAFYADLGPYAGILINAKQKTSGSSIVYSDKKGTIPLSVDQSTGEPFPVSFDANTDILNDCNKFNLGLTGGIGFSHTIGMGDISLDIRGAYGLTTVQKDSQSGSSHTGNLLFALGYSIPF
jgi:hypothetical protein